MVASAVRYRAFDRHLGLVIHNGSWLYHFNFGAYPSLSSVYASTLCTLTTVANLYRRAFPPTPPLFLSFTKHSDYQNAQAYKPSTQCLLYSEFRLHWSIPGRA